MASPILDQYRRKVPDLADVPDEELAEQIRRTYYPNADPETFKANIGVGRDISERPIDRYRAQIPRTWGLDDQELVTALHERYGEGQSIEEYGRNLGVSFDESVGQPPARIGPGPANQDSVVNQPRDRSDNGSLVDGVASLVDSLTEADTSNAPRRGSRPETDLGSSGEPLNAGAARRNRRTSRDQRDGEIVNNETRLERRYEQEREEMGDIGQRFDVGRGDGLNQAATLAGARERGITDAPLRVNQNIDQAAQTVYQMQGRGERSADDLARGVNRARSAIGAFNLVTSVNRIADARRRMQERDALSVDARMRLTGEGPKNPAFSPEAIERRLVSAERRDQKIIEQEQERAQEIAESLARLREEREELGENVSLQRALESGDADDFLDQLISGNGLDVMSGLVLESLPAMAPALGAGVAGGAVAGPAGFAAGTGTVSAITEGLFSLQEKLREYGADLEDPESVARVWDERGGEIVRDSATRAALIGAFDAASGGLAATRIIPRAQRGASFANRAARSVAEGGTQLTAQAAAGSAGEASAQFASEGRIENPAAVLAEGVAEFGFAPVEVAGAAISGARRRIAGPADADELRTRMLNEGYTENDDGTLQRGDIVVEIDGDEARARINTPNVPVQPRPGAQDDAPESRFADEFNAIDAEINQIQRDVIAPANDPNTPNPPAEEVARAQERVDQLLDQREALTAQLARAQQPQPEGPPSDQLDNLVDEFAGPGSEEVAEAVAPEIDQQLLNLSRQVNQRREELAQAGVPDDQIETDPTLRQLENQRESLSRIQREAATEQAEAEANRTIDTAREPTNDALGEQVERTRQEAEARSPLRDEIQRLRATSQQPAPLVDQSTTPIREQARALRERARAQQPPADRPVNNPATGEFTPERIATDEIQIDPETYQFRDNVNRDGVDDRLEGIERFDDLRAGTVIVHQREDGSTFVADGHHRVDLARRLGRDSLNAIVLRESDGFSAADARRFAAERNIAEGNATAIDAAKVFRETGGDPASVIEGRDLPRRSQAVRDGAAIAQLSDDAFGALLNEQISEKDAAAIGRNFTDPDQQIAAVEQYQRVRPDNERQRQILADEIREAGFSQGEQGGLFGDGPAESLITERVRIIDSLVRRLSRSRSLFRTINENASTAEQAGNRIARDQNQAIQQNAELAADLVRRASTIPEINQAINDGAQRVKDGESLRSVVDELEQRVTNEAQRIASTPQGAAPDTGVGPTDQAGQDAGAGQSVSARDAGRDGAGREQRLSGAESELLTQPTPEDLQARDQAEADRQTAEREAEQRADADAQRDNFTLTGSDTEADQAAARGQDTLFSRGNQQGGGLDAREAATRAADLMQGWKIAPRINVTRNESELPRVLQQKIIAKGAQGQVRGVFHQGEVYLVADNLQSIAEMEETILHEVLGHFGIRNVLGANMDRVLRDAYLTIGRRELQPIADQYELDLDTTEGRNEAVEEYLARMAEANPDAKIIDRVIRLIAEWARSMGFNLQMTHSELRELMVRSKRFARDGEIVSGVSISGSMSGGVAMQASPSQGGGTSRFSIARATERAKQSSEQLRITSEEEFFGNIWPKFLRQAGLRRSPTQRNMRRAARQAIADMQDWLRENPRFMDYYNADMEATREIVESVFGQISNEQFQLFQLYLGVNSPNTGLRANINDAFNAFGLYLREGNLDSIEMGQSAKGNPVIQSSPFEISGTTAPNKARTMKVVDRLIKEQGGVGEALAYLQEEVPVAELHEFNREMGYKGQVGNIGSIRSLVQEATGQDERVPRMFIFGRKVGAYTLNTIGDSRYTTIDIWESRFVRSYFAGMFADGTGLPVNENEHKFFSQFNRVFKQEIEAEFGQEFEASALQAMRWFYILNAAREAGYVNAKTESTISEYAAQIAAERFGAADNESREIGDEEAARDPLDDTRFSFNDEGETRFSMDAAIPPAENAKRTQIAGTYPTYEKADNILNSISDDGTTLDFGAGLGMSQERLGYDTYEPFPKDGFTPTYTKASDIPSDSYGRVTSLNVLNVVPKDVRDGIVKDIGRVLKPGGFAVITTRGRDVLSANGVTGPEPTSVITNRGTYQKGFTQKELRDYVSSVIGDEFEVESVKLGPAGVIIRKLANIDDDTRFSFAGRGSRTADLGNLESAQALDENGVNRTAILQQTGWFKGPDGRWRYEITDEGARLNGGEIVTADQVLEELSGQIVTEQATDVGEGSLIRAYIGQGADYVAAFGRTEEQARNALARQIAKQRTAPNVFDASNIKKLRGNFFRLDQVLDHEKLFAAYPNLASIYVHIRDLDGARGQFNQGEDIIEIAPAEPDQFLSTLMHEIQHAIQEREGFARGGNSNFEFWKAAVQGVKDLDTDARNRVIGWQFDNQRLIDEAETAAFNASMGLAYQSAQRLRDYASRERPSQVFQLIRKESQWLYETTFDRLDEARELQSRFFAIPKRGPRRNQALSELAYDVAEVIESQIPDPLLNEFRNDTRKTESMVRALQRASNRARERTNELSALQREARRARELRESPALRSPHETYLSLAGEVEARNVQARLGMTEDERVSRTPQMTQDVDNERAIVIFGGLEMQVPAASVMSSDEAPSARFSRRGVRNATSSLEANEAANRNGFPVKFRNDAAKATTAYIAKDRRGDWVTVRTSSPALREQNALQAWLKKYFTKEGQLTDRAYELHTQVLGQRNADEIDISGFTADFLRSVSRAYGRSYMRLSDSEKEALNEYLAGQDIQDIPDTVKAELDVMRGMLDNASTRVQMMLLDEVRYVLQSMSGEQSAAVAELIKRAKQGDDDAITEIRETSPKGDLIARKMRTFLAIEANKGGYLHRSYRAFDDPSWKNNVPSDVMRRAKDYLRQQVRRDPAMQNLDASGVEDRVDGIVNAILNSDSSDMVDFLSQRQLGEKDLTVLKQRENIPEPIRELMGEYKDPRVNFSRTMSHMSSLLTSHHFLRSVREEGLGEYLSAEASGRMSQEITSFNEEKLLPLAGLYTTPEFRQALIDFADGNNLDGWLKQVVRLTSSVKYGKTVLSPTTMFRNFYSAMMFTVMNGHFGYGNILNAAQTTWADIRGNTRARRDYMRRLAELGVIHDSARAGEITAALDDIMDLDTTRGSAPVRAGKEALNIATRMYQAGDDFWKIVGYETEVKDLVNSGMDRADAEVMAAKRVRDGYPTYSMVPEAIQQLRRFPLVGTFVSFPWEIMRTSFNQLRMVREDLDAGRNAKAARRLTGMAIAYSSAYAIKTATMAIFGIDDEEDEAVRKLAAPWQMNSQFAYLGHDEDGRMRYLDLSHLDPYNHLKRPITALMNGNYDNVGEGAVEGMKEFLAPYLGTDITAGVIGEIWANKKQSTGSEVYDENADRLTQGMQAANHLLSTLRPGILLNVERTLKAFNDQMTTYGREYTLQDEAMAWVGFRLTTSDPKVSMQFKSFDFVRQRNGASSPTYEALREPNVIGEREVREGVQSTYSRWEDAFEEMHAVVRAGRVAGLSDQEITKSLDKGGVPQRDIAFIIREQIPPWSPTNQSLENAVNSVLQFNDTPEMRENLRERFRAMRREVVAQRRRLVQEQTSQ